MDLLHSTIVDALNDAVAKRPSGIAFTFLDGDREISITYLELMTKARAIAVAMRSSVTPGDRVALLYPAGIDFIEAFFACMYAEVIAIPVHPPQNPELTTSLQRVNESLEPALWLSTTIVLDKLKKLFSVKRPVLNKIVTIFSGDKPFDGTPSNPYDLEKLPWFTTEKIDAALAVRFRQPVINPDAVALLQYTSDTLGHPKGVMLTHSNMAHNLEMNRMDTELHASDVCVSWLPPFHNIGLIIGILQPIYSQIPVYLMTSRAFFERPGRWLQAISKYKATISGAPDFAYQLCLSAMKPEEKNLLDLSSWEIAFCSGESVRPTTLDNFYKAFRSCGVRKEIFYPAYGLTETTVYALGSKRNMGAQLKHVDKDALALQKIVPVTPYVATAQAVISYTNNAHFQQVRIINPDTLIECAEGELGEIWLKSPSVAVGYWKQPTETKKTFQNFINDEGPFLRTGDLGYKQQDNQVIVTGRQKELIIIDGKNYFPHDIEYSVSRCHSDLTPGGLAALGTKKNGAEQLIIIAEVDEISGERANAIFSTIRRRVSDNYGIRVYSIFLIPRKMIKKTLGGKIRRSEIRKRYFDNNLEPLYQWTEKTIPATHKAFKPVEQKVVVASVPITPVPTPVLSATNVLTDQKVPAPEDLSEFIIPGMAVIPPTLPAAEKQKVQEPIPLSDIEFIGLETTQSSKKEPEKVSFDESTVKNWLLYWVARRLDIRAGEIETDKNFSSQGMDSLLLMNLAGAIEEQWHLTINPNVLCDNPTIDTLSQYLANRYKHVLDPQAEESQTKVIKEEQVFHPQVIPPFGPEVVDEHNQIQIDALASDTRLDTDPQEGKSLVAQNMPTTQPDFKDHDIAIIGYSCRFPGGAHSPELLWQILTEHKDVISDVPRQRWNNDADLHDSGKLETNRGGFLKDIDQFDGEFFGLLPHELKYMDPQQRLLLEVAWEALERSGVAPCSLKGTNAAVYIGISGNDYAKLIHAQEGTTGDASIPMGNALSMAAGRLSYFLGLEGSCLSVDTACSSALTAIHLAIGALRREECSLALSGSVNLILTPEHSINLSQAGMLSPDGHCKSFDSAANGFTRSEGCGVFVLKRLQDALQDNDNIVGIIKGSALNRDGVTAGLPAPGVLAQKALIAKTLQDAHLKALDIDYVEAHGIGNPVSDSIEVKALRVLGHKRYQPLLIGAIKSNLGHTEAVAGAAGVMKVLLSFEHDCIPANLHFNHINPDINLEEIPAKIVVNNTPWPKKLDRIRRAGVSSFGFSGTNAHLVLEEAPDTNAKVEINDKGYHLFILSARTPAGLMDLASKYQIFLSDTSLSLAEIAYTACMGRSHFAHRLAIIAHNTEDLLVKLQHHDYKNEVGQTQNNAMHQEQVNYHLEKLADCKGMAEESAAHLQSLANLYLHYCDVDWSRLYESTLKKVVLPTYCFQRNSYWLSEITKPVEQTPSKALKYARSDSQPCSAPNNSLGTYYYDLVCEPKPLSFAKNEASSEIWLFFSGEEGLAKSIQQRVAAKNIHVIEACFGRDFNPNNKAHLLAILKGHQKVNKIIYSPCSWQKIQCEQEGLDIGKKMPELIEKNALNLLVFLQALRQVELQNNPVIFFITNGEYPFESSEINLVQSAAIGLYKTFILEHPHLTCRYIDLDSADGLIEKSAILRDEISSDEQESQCVYRQNCRYVVRLINQLPSVDASCVILNSNGSYLITSLSGLSLQVAEWLVTQGARHIVLVGKDEPSVEKINNINLLRDKAVLEVHSLDISDIEQTRQLISHFNKEWPPLCGLIHTADFVENESIALQTVESVHHVFKPKVYGAWNLHTACLESQTMLDFFILFSSLASVLGAPGQSNYAAANSFLDSFAFYRQSVRLPALSVNWGAWPKVSAASDLSASHQEDVLIPLSQREGLSALTKALITTKAQLIFAGINWQQYLEKILKKPSWLQNFSKTESHGSIESSDALSLEKIIRKTDYPEE